MSLSLILPKPLTNNNSTKEKIVSVLSVRWPLSTKELFTSLKNEQGFNGTYQAVHKIVKELQKERVVQKNGTELMLDKNWIENLLVFTQNLNKNYSENTSKEKVVETATHLTFACVLDFGKFLINNYYANPQFNPMKRPCVCFWTHVYPATGIDQKTYENLKIIFQNPQHYGIARHDTLADKVFSNYLNKIGKKCVNGVDYSAKNDTFVNGDYVLEIFFPPKISKHMHKIYSEVKDVKELELQNFFEFVTDTEFKIDAILFKNKELAEKLTNEAMELYGGKRK